MQTAERRQALDRAHAKALQLARIFFTRPEPGKTQADLEALRLRWARHMRQNRKNCSCQMCRNPRHSAYQKGINRLTWQERRQLVRERTEAAE